MQLLGYGHVRSDAAGVLVDAEAAACTHGPFTKAVNDRHPDLDELRLAAGPLRADPIELEIFSKEPRSNESPALSGPCFACCTIDS